MPGDPVCYLSHKERFVPDDPENILHSSLDNIALRRPVETRTLKKYRDGLGVNWLTPELEQEKPAGTRCQPSHSDDHCDADDRPHEKTRIPITETPVWLCALRGF